VSFMRIAEDVPNYDQIDHVGIGVLSSAHPFFDIYRCNISRVPSRVPICVATQMGDRNWRTFSEHVRFWFAERESRKQRKGVCSCIKRQPCDV
jgi:hypothetical protein